MNLDRFSRIAMKCLIAILFGLTLISLIGSGVAAVESASRSSVDSLGKANSKISYVEDSNENVRDYDDEDEEDVIYDERQTDGETNIRLHIKNLQIQVPESSLNTFQKSDMATMIQQSIFKLFGIPFEKPNDQSHPSQQDLAEEQQEQQQQTTSNSMLQVNGNNLPAKFFLEISDFLMNNRDNDAVDDKRVETNHKQNAEIYATEEIKIERLENVNNVKNETITISKKRYSQSPQPDPQSLTTFEMTHKKFSNNVTLNNTEKEDRFQQTRPIRLDAVVMQVETDAGGRPKTLREKVIWRTDGDGNIGDDENGSLLIRPINGN